MKVSKVIIIVVALHVLVIGGIFVFEGCSRTRVGSPDQMAEEGMPAPLADSSVVENIAPVESTTGLVPANGDSSVPGGPVAAIPPTGPGVGPAMSTPPPAPATYAVKKGDSLWKIAKNEGVTIAELASANNLNAKSPLQIGQVLTIPAKNILAADTTGAVPAGMAPAVLGSSADGTLYSVKSGDSLWKIARANNTTVSAIKQANSLNGDMLKVGQQLRLPSASVTAAASAAAPTPAPEVRAGLATSGYNMEFNEPGTTLKEDGKFYHVVDFNESLGSIAAKYGVSPAQLKSANNIAGAIHPGQKLLIPSASAASPTAAAVGTTDASLAMPIVSAPAAVN